MISLSRSRRGAPASGRGSSTRLWVLVALGLVLVAAALAAARELRLQHLAAQLDGDEDDTGAPRAALAAALGPRALPFFTHLLEAPTDGVRLAAVDYLLDQPGNNAFRRVAPLMADDYSQIRLRIVEAAARGQGPEAQRLLLAATADEDVWIRQFAVAALARQAEYGGNQSPETLAALARAVDDPDPAVVSTAMSVMRGLAGHGFGYRSRSSDRERAAAVSRWRDWWEREAPAGAPPLPPPVGITRIEPAPDFTVTDVDGRNWALSRLRGKVVLLHFFGTWCGACQEEMPHLQQLHQEKGPGLVVLGAAIAEKGPAVVRAYAHQHSLTFPIALAPESLTDAYGHIHEVPISYVIDGFGRIRRRFDGDRDLGTLRQAVAAVMK